MKDYRRKDPFFSLCGLNCGLCPMRVGGWCPGCGGGEGHQPCAFIRCGLRHGAKEHCSECAEYPCPRFEEAMRYDSFMPHSRMRADLDEAQEMGAAAYGIRLRQKETLLQELLANYNDGRKKTLFCCAAGLLPLETLEAAVRQLRAQVPADAPVKEKAAQAADLLNDAAARQGVVLKLHKKPKE